MLSLLVMGTGDVLTDIGIDMMSFLMNDDCFEDLIDEGGWEGVGG